MDMSDTSWSQLHEPHERLRWARSHHFASARSFAASIGMQSNTYAAYEREPGSSKFTRLTAEKAMQFGRKLKVRWEWLLEGSGVPWPDNSEASRNRPGAQAAELIDALEDPEEQVRALEILRLATRRTGTIG